MEQLISVRARPVTVQPWTGITMARAGTETVGSDCEYSEDGLTGPITASARRRLKRSRFPKSGRPQDASPPSSMAKAPHGNSSATIDAIKEECQKEAEKAGVVLAALDQTFPAKQGTLELVIERQPDANHRARYEKEGCRGCIKDRSGNAYPAVRLKGIEGPSLLQMFVATASGHLRPHPVYRVCKVVGANCTPCRQRAIQNIPVLGVDITPENGGLCIVNCVGILKLRNSDLEGSAEVKELTGRRKRHQAVVRLVFRAITWRGNMPVTLQTSSTPISCDDEKVVWQREVPLQQEFLHTVRLVASIPPFHMPISKPVNVQLVVRNKSRVSEPYPFTYVPDDAIKVKLQPSSMPDLVRDTIGHMTSAMTSPRLSVSLAGFYDGGAVADTNHGTSVTDCPSDYSTGSVPQDVSSPLLDVAEAPPFLLADASLSQITYSLDALGSHQPIFITAPNTPPQEQNSMTICPHQRGPCAFLDFRASCSLSCPQFHATSQASYDGQRRQTCLSGLEPNELATPLHQSVMPIENPFDAAHTQAEMDDLFAQLVTDIMGQQGI